MAYTLAAMRTEVYERGFQFLNDSGTGTARVVRWLNDAMHQIDDLADWPYLNATTSGAAPLTIADLRTIEMVSDLSSNLTLEPIDRRELRQAYVSLTTTGTATMYYVTGGTTINVYPASTVSLTVDYWKVAPDMSADGDTPLMPDRYRRAIIEYAVARAKDDAGDDQGAAATRAVADQLVGQMMQTLLMPQHQAAQAFVVGWGDDQ